MIIRVHNLRNIKEFFPVISWLIMVMQGMNPIRRKSYSHMAISVEYKDGSVVFYDSSSRGVKSANSLDFLDRYKSVESFEIIHNLKSEDFDYWFSINKKKKYDFLQLIGLFLKLIGLKSLVSFGYGSSRLICCEFVLLLLNKIKPFEINNSDNYDLIETNRIVREYAL